MAPKLTLTISCPMNLWIYPFDTQECPLRVASYEYLDFDLVLVWKEIDPVQVKTSISTKGFTLKEHEEDYCSRKTITGKQPCVMELFYFKRLTFYYILHIYLPLALLVAISWISFWLIPSSTRSRLTISIGTSVCILLQLYSNSIHFLSLDYFTALDIWAAICCITVFGALAENLCVDYIYNQKIKAVPFNEKRGEGNESKTEAKFLLEKASDQTPKIDAISRIVFPLFFVLNNVIYWSLLFYFKYYKRYYFFNF